MRKIIIFTTCMFLSFRYSWGVLEGQYQNSLATTKPYVYRQLVPILASFSPLDFATSVAMTSLAFCIGVIILMFYIYEKNYTTNLANDVLFILAFAITIAFSSKCAAYYDMASAFFFLLLPILWSKGKYKLSIPIFALACLNRETAILLVPFFFVVHKNVWFTTLMVSVFACIRQMIVWVFSDAEGMSMYIAPIENIKAHADHILPTVVLILIAVLALALVFRKKKNVPFVFTLFPFLLGIYIILGYPFETRVFIEVMPTMFLSAFLIPD